MSEKPVAALDCGTNSTRLLVADSEGRPIERLMTITRLGEGVDKTGRLSPGAVGRALAALSGYRAVMDRLGVGAVRMAATSAARDASNRDEFFDLAAGVVGAAPELLGGDAEGALSFAGATAELDAGSGPWLIADIGGGSTELAVGDSPGGTPVAVVSLDVGCVRITERFLRGDPPEPARIEAARRAVAEVLQDASSRVPAFRTATALVGLAGTVATLAAIDQQLDSYDRDRVHHYRLSRSGVDTLLRDMGAETSEQRGRRPGMEPGRVDVIVGGTIVLAALMDHFGFDECLTSEADILDGMVMSLLEPQSAADPAV